MPVAAGVVSDLDMLALLAAPDMPAQRRRAAVLDHRHHLELFEAHMAGIGLTPCRTMRAEDIRELERRARHARRVSSGRCGVLEGFDEMIERAHDVTQRIGGNARVESRSVELAPSNTWITRISTFCSSRCVAKLCRNVCGLTRLLIS